MRNEASYLKPLASFVLGAAGTRVISQFCTVVRIYTTTAGNATFSGTGAVVPLGVVNPEYFRVTPGETVTASAGFTITEMT